MPRRCDLKDFSVLIVVPLVKPVEHYQVGVLFYAEEALAVLWRYF
jgi:hypothetical protein